MFELLFRPNRCHGHRCAGGAQLLQDNYAASLLSPRCSVVLRLGIIGGARLQHRPVLVRVVARFDRLAPQPSHTRSIFPVEFRIRAFAGVSGYFATKVLVQRDEGFGA